MQDAYSFFTNRNDFKYPNIGKEENVINCPKYGFARFKWLSGINPS